MNNGYKISEEYEKKIDTKFKKYTPQDIARKMLAVSFFRYFKGKKLQKLQKLKLIDLSCGTGNFLCEALDFLIKMSKIYYGEYKYNESWITGIDIDKNALEIANARLNKILVKYNLPAKKFQLKNKNGLLHNFTKKYNIVIGNPPYLGEKNNREKFSEIKESDFGKKYYEGKIDYFYFFIEKGIDILAKNGILTYITTNYWLRADYAKKLRKKLKEEVSFFYINNYNKSMFKNAIGQHNMIFALEKKIKNQEINVISNSEKFTIKNNEIFNENQKIILAPEEKILLFKKIKEKSNVKLGEILNINQGIVSGCDKGFVLKKYDEKFKKYLKPLYKSKDILHYTTKVENDFWILYLDRESVMDELIEKHLKSFQKRLENRREVKKDIIKWFQLQWCRSQEMFEMPKIIAKQRGRERLFAYSDKDFYGSADIYYLTPKKENFNLFYILGYLNSKVFYDWFYYNGKTKGKNLELYSTPLKETPIYYPEKEEELEYIANLTKKQIKNYKIEVQNKIDEYFKNKLLDY